MILSRRINGSSSERKGNNMVGASADLVRNVPETKARHCPSNWWTLQKLLIALSFQLPEIETLILAGEKV
jgi:hypothetical protein